MERRPNQPRLGLVVVRVGDGLVEAAGRDEDGGVDRRGVVKRGAGHLTEDPGRTDLRLHACRQAHLLERPPLVQGLLVQVVVGLHDVPVREELAVVPQGARAAAQPPDKRRALLVDASAVDGDNSALVRPGPRHGEEAGRHEVQVIELLHGRLEVCRGFHDLSRGEGEALDAVREANLDVRRQRVVARVLREAPATEAHGREYAGPAGPVEGYKEGLAATHEENLERGIGQEDDTATVRAIMASEVQVPAVDHGAIRHGRKDVRATRGVGRDRSAELVTHTGEQEILHKLRWEAQVADYALHLPQVLVVDLHRPQDGRNRT
mmetsp:Transcript_10511/g.33228  ORF Transcript_10511/g.33228 Transcript_10511/m.33228 type:complete len:321 (-) Transcript_10511:362-1324(-)